MSATGNISIIHASDFKKLFDGYYVPLCLFAQRYLDHPADAADTVQDIFIKLWQRRYDFDNIFAIKSFLYTAVRNASLNRLEHLKVVEKYRDRLTEMQSDVFFHDHVIEQERFRIFWAAIHALPDQTRRVMLLALDGKDNREIANSLGIAQGTVHTHKKIAYKRLRYSLRDQFLPLFLFYLLTVGK